MADDQLETPHFNISRLRENELGEESVKPSYHRTTPRKLAVHSLTKAHINVPDMPAVTAVRPPNPAPVREEAPEPIAEVAPAPVFVQAAPAPKRGLFAPDRRDQGRGRGAGGHRRQGRPSARNEARGDRPDRGPRGEGRRDRGGRDRGPRGERPARIERDKGTAPAANGGGKPQPQAAQAAQQPKPPKQERTEEQKKLDEARRLEGQQRREET